MRFWSLKTYRSTLRQLISPHPTVFCFKLESVLGIFALNRTFTHRYVGRVEGSYYAPPLSVRSQRASFLALRSRISLVFQTFAHVDIVVTASMNCQEILGIPIAVIAIDVMQFYFFFIQKFQSTMSA